MGNSLRPLSESLIALCERPGSVRLRYLYVSPSKGMTRCDAHAKLPCTLNPRRRPDAASGECLRRCLATYPKISDSEGRDCKISSQVL